MKKAQIQFGGIVAIILLILAAIFTATTLSVVMTDEGEYEPVIINNKHIKDFDELRAVSPEDYSDEEYIESGVIQLEDGLYSKVRTGAIK